MPESREAFLARRKKELMHQLTQVHDTLTDLQDVHNATPYKCHRSGHCCTVGLQLHYMECEYMAEKLKEQCADDPKQLKEWIRKLEASFKDEAWTWDTSVGDRFCAFYNDGCTIYPFRPSVCRAYGVTIDLDEWCPRKRLPKTGEAFIFGQKETDRLSAEFYRTLDTYGRLFPKRDYTVFMPRGVLEFLVSSERMEKLKATTPKKFWKREKGYRNQYEPSYQRPERRVTNVKFKFAIPRAR